MGMRTVSSGDKHHGLGPALLARHAHPDHDLLLQQQPRAKRSINMFSEQTKIKQSEGTKERISNSGGCCPVTLVIADLVVAQEKPEAEWRSAEATR
jgi:hypothetical protein